MKLTTAKANVSLIFKGSGTVSVDWGDGKNETINLLESEKCYGHSYTGSLEHKITITGDTITYLKCSENELTSLTISGDPELKTLWCGKNQLTSLNVSGLSQLSRLYCSDNLLSSLDVSKNNRLEKLRCSRNKLTNLDASKNILLQKLRCRQNQLSNLTVSNLSNLVHLNCTFNNISGTRLNNLFTSLPTVPYVGCSDLYIEGNPGAKNATGGCDTTIATNKRWAIDFHSLVLPIETPPVPPPTEPMPDNLQNPSQADTDAERRKQIVDGLSWGAYDPNTVLLSNYYSEKEGDKPADYIQASTGVYAATIVKKLINNEQIFIIGQGYKNVIYPGAILIADNDLAAGKAGALVNVQRAPVDLYGDYFSGSSTSKKDIAASSDNVHDAINSMVNDYFNSPGWEASQAVQIETTYHSSKKTMALEFGCDLSFCGNSAKLDLTSNSEEQSIVESFNCKQKFLTVRLGDNWKQGFDKLFGDKETWSNILSRSNNQPLCIVTSVIYGRNIHFLKEYKFNSLTIKSSQDVNFYGQHLTSKQDITESSEAKKSAFIAIGASGAITGAGLDAASDITAISKAIKENATFSKTVQGDVIGYELLLLSGKNAGKTIAPVYNGFVWTTEYKRCPNTLQVNVHCNAWTLGSEKNVKVRLDAIVVTIKDGKCIKLERRMLMEKRYKGEVSTYETTQINLKENEYIFFFFFLSIRGKASSLSSWWQGHTSKIDSSLGAIKLKINGTTRAGAGNLYIASDSPTQSVV
jgi:hypothetical protein